jgi:hypothetical protein
MSTRALRVWLRLALLASCLAGVAGIHAEEGGPAAWAPVDDARLDAARGGFDWGGGLVASLGIDRAVYVNGTLVTSLHVQVPDIARVSAAQANALSTALSDAAVVRNGPGNTVDPTAFAPSTAAMVLQNTLDNQRLAAQTTLNVSVNTLGAFRGLNLQQSLQAAVANSLGR